jgi:hypothetical protein
MPKLGKQGKARVQELKKLGVEDPRKYLLAGRATGFTGKEVVKAAEGGGARNTKITETLGGSRFSGGSKADEPPTVSRPPTAIDRSSRTGGGNATPGGAPAFFDSGGSAGGGAGGGNPLTSGSASSAVGSGDLDRVLHGGKRKGRVRKTRGTE